MAEYFDVYSNQVSIQVSQWDFTFQYGLLAAQPVRPNKPAEQDEEPQPVNIEVATALIQQLGTVRVSHVQAKVLAILMKRVLKQHEEVNGEITIPRTVQARHNFSEDEW